VIAIDLNPLSRTSRAASITIVDNVVRAIPNMVRLAREMRNLGRDVLMKILTDFNNDENLGETIRYI
jgi:4-phosphopantoate--beta-alanine ligase